LICPNFFVLALLQFSTLLCTDLEGHLPLTRRLVRHGFMNVHIRMY